MLTTTLSAILRRDLTALRREIEAYPDDAAIWRTAPGLPNSGGVLCRHLCGNLRHFVGAAIGGSGYRRQRDAEFQAPPVPREELLHLLAATEAEVLQGLARLTETDLRAPFPHPVDGRTLETADFLVHLVVHLGFHLGQIDYHRRALSGATASIAPMGIAALASAVPAVPPP
ncbi:MAG TPA: DinB family protein [Gemmatimonadales bacterium]|nr:DinB family protein [Gemmatimonadales bacterium]